jgi:hypothetical protein
MSRILKRPMFSLGGPASAGITSGLSRQGYKEAGSVDWGEVDVIADQMKKRYGAVPRQGYNVWDFLTEWGLNMASSPPMGNVIQTAAGTAREPYGKFVEGKGKDEMTEYMANMASTDKALSAFTNIKAAEAEALGKRTLADRSDERILMEDPLKIMAEANKTNLGSLTIAAQPSGALGIVKAKILIRDENAKGHNDVRQVPVVLFKQDQKTQLWDFDEQLLDIDTIWYDINKKQVMTITMEGEKKVADYHSSADAARDFLGKKSKDTGAVDTGGVAEGEGEGEGTDDKTQIIGAQGVVVTIAEGDWNNGKTLSGNIIKDGKVYDKDLIEGKGFRLIPDKNLNYLGNNRWHPFKYAKKEDQDKGSPELGGIDQYNMEAMEDTTIYLPEEDGPSKIVTEEKEKDYSDLDRWWKNQTSNYGAGFQGVN